MRPIGIHVSYWQALWSDALPPLFARAKTAGFDGVEIPLLDPASLDITAIAEALQEQNLRCTCGTGLNRSTDITSPDAAIRKVGMEHLTACLQIAAALDSPGVGGVTYTPWASFSDEPILARRKRCIQSLREIGKIAGDLGRTLFLEVINRYESDLINTVEQGILLLEEVDSPYLKLHLDTYHMNIEEDNLRKAIICAGSRVGHFHCSENNRRVPGMGHIPWKEVRAGLDAIGYTGWLVIESFVTAQNEVGRGTFTWRNLGEQLDQEAGQAARFLREELALD